MRISFLVSLTVALIFLGFSCGIDIPDDDPNYQPPNLDEVNKPKPSTERDTSGNALQNAKQVATNYFELSYKDASYVQHDNSGHEPNYYLSSEPRGIATLSACPYSEPDNIVYRTAKNVAGNEMLVEFEAGYGDYPDYDYEPTWRFYLKFENGEWKIKEIRCI